jgi:hypothetical protein
MRTTPHRTIFAWLLGLGVVATSAAAETSAASRLELGVCIEDGDACVSAAHVGLRPDGLWVRSMRVHRGAHELTLDTLRVHIDGMKGLWLEGRGMTGALVPIDNTPRAVAKYHEEKAAKTAPHDREQHSASGETPDTSANAESRALGRVLAPARRIAARIGRPVYGSVEGELSVSLGSHASLHAQRVDAKVDPQGEARGRVVGHARVGLDAVARSSSLLVTSTREAGTNVQGEVMVAGAPLVINGRARGQRVRTLLTDATGGRMSLQFSSPRSVAIKSAGFHIPPGLAELAQKLEPRLQLNLDSTALDGAVYVELRDNEASMRFDQFSADGLTVQHRALARDPVTWTGWEATGTLTLRDGARAVSLALAHDDIRLRLEGETNAEAIMLDIELDEAPCSDLLDAIPDAMSQVIGSTTLEGRVGGHARLHVDRAALTRVQEIEARTGIPQPDPGVLAFDIPVEDACTVTALPPAIDVEALARPYVHRFHDGDRNLRRRVFDTSHDDFVALAKVRSQAQAFIALEDLNFRRHRGFDREQIRRAVWHNLTEGRFSRGASTISQQTARNLWLGIDRSLGRKIQEALLTRELEAHLTKDRILEIYINIIELGPGIYGVKEAAEFYFGRSPEDLNLIERIHLASLAPAPSGYSRKWRAGNVDEAWHETLRRHIRRMRRKGYITGAQAAAAARAPLRLLDRSPRNSPTPAANFASPAHDSTSDSEDSGPSREASQHASANPTLRHAAVPSSRSAAAP